MWPHSPPMWELCSHTLRGEGAPPLRPRVTFPPRGKSPKARQGLRPLESPGVSARHWEPDAVRFEGWISRPIKLEAITIPYRPFRARCAALRLAPGYLLPQTQTDLPLCAEWANRSCFFLWFHRGNTFYFQFVARQVGCLRGYRKFYTLATNTARAQGRGIKGGRS